MGAPTVVARVMLAASSVTAALASSDAANDQARALRFVEAAHAGLDYRSSVPSFDRKLAHINGLWASFMAGAAVGDVNADGLDDVFLVSSEPSGQNALYLNEGALRFRDIAPSAGVARLNDRHGVGVGALWMDYDNDGDRDLFLLRLGTNRLLENDGRGVFRDVTVRSGLGGKRQNPMAAITFDYDNDGDLDVLVGGFFSDDVDLFALTRTTILPEDGHNAANGGTKTLYQNNGDGTFTDVSANAGIRDTGFTAALGHGDYDDDGWQDVYIANDFGPDKLYRNDRGAFVDVTPKALGEDTRKGMNADFGDFNNDGRLDIYVTNITQPWLRECNMLWQNWGDGRFVDVSEGAGVCDTGWGWGAKFFDADNDGWVDLFVANGFVSGSTQRYEEDMLRWSQRLQRDRRLKMTDASVWPPLGGKTFAGYERKRLFHNHGGVFTDVARPAGVDNDLDGRGVAVADFDRDGRLELLVTHANERPHLYRNATATPHHWLQLDLVGRRSNRDAIGARVVARTAGLTQVRQVDGGNGYAAQSSHDVHFGLADATTVDLQVRWPSGVEQRLRAVRVDQRLRVEEPADEVTDE